MTGQRLTRLSRSVEGTPVIVTGAASDMGRATAHLFADEGARVAVVDVGAERVRTVTDEILAAHGSHAARGWVCDVSDPVAIKSMVAEVAAEFGGIGVVVNNAGISLIGGALSDEETFEEGWRRTLDVNLTAHARIIRAAVPWLREAPNGGRIVNIASTEGVIATGGIAAYTAAKHGVIGLTKSFAVEIGRLGINVNCVCPGPINTGMTAGIPDEAKEAYAKRRVPLRRYGDPEEVAQMTFSLCLPAASFCNGAVLVVDGGMTIRHT
jgi:3-oxoacyl-[acyl-carrier protein] reductase